MIRTPCLGNNHALCKPRASGDDPYLSELRMTRKW